MFCPKCGTKLNGTEDFCSNCGENIKKIAPQIKSEVDLDKRTEAINKTTMTEVLSSKSAHFAKSIIVKLKMFYAKYKKPLIALGGCLSVLIIGFILFNKFYDFTKISWDPENKDINITHTQPTTVVLRVLASDKQKNEIKNITFSADDGEIKAEGATVKWKLPKEEGTYTITASAPSGKKIQKSITVINLEANKKNTFLAGIIELPEEENADNDKDGLTNTEEQKLGTDKDSGDTDKDGINDYYEVNETKTNPLEKDTDKDGINDGDELDLGLDPLKPDSKGDGVNDGKRTLTYAIENDKLGVTLEINGQGNIASSTIDVLTNSPFSNMDGLLDKVYNFYSAGTIESATVKIKYTLEELQAKGLDEDNLTLYYFNEETKQLESLPTTVEKENKQIIVTLKHFSKYVIGDKKATLNNYETEIMFVIDNSVSMYSESQMIEAGYNSSRGAVGNDVNFKRLTLTNNMIDLFTGNYKFGVAEFSGNYVNLKKFTNATSELKKAVNSMRNNWNSDTDGTNIVSALKSGISEFSSSNEDNHYLILLTDGKNTKESLSYNKSTIITNAKNNKVKVCVIGIGSEIDTDDLNEIAKSTGCDYYNASDSSALDEIYSVIGANINYNYVDTDGDNKVDGMIQASSGFLVNRDGFNFQNFTSNKSDGGHCYGMATFAMLYYLNELPTSLPAKDNSRFYISELRTVDLKSNGYDLSNTYFAKKNNNLYDYKIKDEGLSILLGENPGDYRDRIENDTWMIKKDYYDKLSKIGSTFSTKDYKGRNKGFTKYQSALLNIDNDTFNNAVSKDDSQMLNAIWRLYILQANAKSTFFSSDPDKAFEELNRHLNKDIPTVLAVTGLGGGHAINAIKLIQDINDSNKFKIEVYDNNYPGETRYITMTRSKYSKFQLDYTAWVNEFDYKFMYDLDNDGTQDKVSVKISSPYIN